MEKKLIDISGSRSPNMICLLICNKVKQFFPRSS